MKGLLALGVTQLQRVCAVPHLVYTEHVLTILIPSTVIVRTHRTLELTVTIHDQSLSSAGLPRDCVGGCRELSTSGHVTTALLPPLTLALTMTQVLAHQGVMCI